jgi:N-acetyl sugar amidotransferase
MIYCKRCLYPANHPLHIVFDHEGVCSGCRVHEEKDALDWTARAAKLRALLEGYKSSTRRNYDCIIPVSGARDSYFIVHTVKNVYGLNPLLVSYNRQYNTRRGQRNLAYLKTLLNCDAIEMVVDPAKVKRVTRRTLERIGSMHWHVLAGQTVFPVQAAVRFKVPLIVWGAHQGLDQVGMFSHTDEVEMTRKYRKEHDLMGLEAEDLVDAGRGVSERDVIPFLYPHDKELEKTGVRGIYLGNYIRWDSKAQHELMIDRYGYETSESQRTFDTYNDVDCQHYAGTHDYVKFAKWGYGKVTDHATREIRLRRMTRETGIELVRRYQDVVPNDILPLMRWLDMSAVTFHDQINRFRDRHVWRRSATSDWELTDSITHHAGDSGVDSVRLRGTDDCVFRITPSRDPAANEREYVLLHKGFMQKDASP